MTPAQVLPNFIVNPRHPAVRLRRSARRGVSGRGCKIASERVRGMGLGVLAYYRITASPHHRIAAASVSGFDVHAHDDLTRRIAVSAAAPENPNDPDALGGMDAKLILRSSARTECRTTRCACGSTSPLSSTEPDRGSIRIASSISQPKTRRCHEND